MFNFIKKNLFFIVIGVAAILFLFVFTDKKDQEKVVDVKPIEASSNKQEATTTRKAANAYIDVKGEVKSPGVYEIAIDSRVEEVINLAGGFTKQANQSVINLAQKVHDEMIILVPKVGDTVIEGGEESAGSGKINLNYASQDEIEELNGIGPSKAQAIIQYREENGLFQTIEDVLNVSGIGEKTLENMKDSIQVP